MDQSLRKQFVFDQQKAICPNEGQIAFLLLENLFVRTSLVIFVVNHLCLHQFSYKQFLMNNRILSFLIFSLSLAFFQTQAIGQSQAVTFKTEKKTAKTGETVCVNFTAAGFNQLLSMQYTIKWDPKVLQFKEVKNFRLPFLTKDNFGFTRMGLGLIPVVWIDNALKGVDLPENIPMFQMCFTVKGKAGTTSAVSFSQSPTPFESINKLEKPAKVSAVNGSVTIK
jgi:hypothetical protein